MQSNSREEILQRIAAVSKGRLTRVEIPEFELNELYKEIQPDAISCFKNELEAISGKCILCEGEEDLYKKLYKYVQESSFSSLFCRDTYISDQLKKHHIPYSSDEYDLESMEAGITGCEFLIARTGSVLVSSATESGRKMNVFPPIHIVLAHVSQIVNYPTSAMNAIYAKYGDALPSTITTITGPSRTADIEKTLVLGAHGPKEFIVFLSRV